MKRISVLLVALFLLFVCSCGGDGGSGSQIALIPSDLGWIIPQADPNNITMLPSGEEISSELISISVKDGVNREEVEEIANEIGGIIAGELPDINAYYIKFFPPRTAAEIEIIVNELRTNPDIDTASPEFIYEFTEAFPLETDIERVGLLTIDQKWGFLDTDIHNAWKTIRESGKDLSSVVVAVVDSGFDLDHPDLKDNFVLELNGRRAWDFGEDDSDVFYDGGYKDQSHGTNVSGIIASVVNEEGINGVAPMAKIFPFKILKKGKVFDYAITASICWAAFAEVDIINLSVGGFLDSDEYKQTMKYTAVKHALKKGIVIVAAAGNDGKEASYFFPAAVDGVISVGAIDILNERSEWTFLEIFSQSSNWSDSSSALWIAAPGTDIYTTDINSSYQKIDGTSIATPFVSGLAALMKQVDPSLSNTEIADIIRYTGDDITVTYPDNSEHNWKKMNALAAINYVLEEMDEINNPPIATIFSPSDNSVFTEGDSVSFSGTGMDNEDGQLFGDSLIWTSDKDGQIETGESFSLTDLSVNSHSITLTVTDSEGETDDDSVEITINSKPVQPSGIRWPMFQHDARHTGQSQFSGPDTPNLLWKIDVGNLYSPPIVNSDGTIYIADDDRLKAYNPDSSLKWEFVSDYYQGANFESCPVIGSNNTIYVSCSYKGLYAVNSDGTLKWKKSYGTDIDLVIGDNDNLYISVRGGIYSINSNGDKLWTYSIDSVELFSIPAVCLDGSVYTVFSDNLLSLNPEGELRWQYYIGGAPFCPPIIDSEGTIYIAVSKGLHAINPDGTQKWKWDYELTNGFYDFNLPGIGPDNTVYVGFNGNLHAVDPSGNLKWTFDLPTLSSTLEPDTFCIDKSGVIYVGTRDSVIAINPNGTLKWKYEDTNSHFCFPVIGGEGRLYAGYKISSLCAFGN